MLGVILDAFSWLPRPLEILCITVIVVFMVFCLVQIIKFIISVVKVIVEIFGGLFGKVVGLFK